MVLIGQNNFQNGESLLISILSSINFFITSRFLIFVAWNVISFRFSTEWFPERIKSRLEPFYFNIKSKILRLRFNLYFGDYIEPAFGLFRFKFNRISFHLTFLLYLRFFRDWMNHFSLRQINYSYYKSIANKS